jgi:indolepyruvate ferredoxin oxidoreductase alpha subunit
MKKTELRRELMSGNEAIGRGAVEAGVSVATSYPGTPATEILQYLADNSQARAEWSVNEKVALEAAIGASYAGRRALCSMKHVGLNVAADPLMTSPYLGVRGGLTLVIADDPGAYSSQNEQDSRVPAGFAKIPCLEASDAQEAKEMVIEAFDLSEKFGLPVMVRTLTRVSHALSPVSIYEPRPENNLSVKRDPARLLAVPANVVRLHAELLEKQEKLRQWTSGSGFNKAFKTGNRRGIIACGITYMYAREVEGDFDILKISAYPLHEDLIRDFVAGLDEVWVLEEGEPIVEELARRYHPTVKGKISGDLKPAGELGPDALREALGQTAPLKTPAKDILKRPPSLCLGCPHRDLYECLKAAKPSFTTGDIGCYTLGAAPPLSAMDSCLCMGASISKATGMSLAGARRVAAVIGDSTFIHTGVPALISAVYNKANILVVIMDNSITAMTGHQPTPHIGYSARWEESGKVEIEGLCRACNVASLEIIDPVNHEELGRLIREKLDADGVNVIISRRPCILTKKR